MIGSMAKSLAGLAFGEVVSVVESDGDLLVHCAVVHANASNTLLSVLMYLVILDPEEFQGLCLADTSFFLFSMSWECLPADHVFVFVFFYCLPP